MTAGAISPEKVAWAAHEHIGDELRFSAFQFLKAGAYVHHKYQRQGKVFHNYDGYVPLIYDGCLYTRLTEGVHPCDGTPHPVQWCGHPYVRETPGLGNYPVGQWRSMLALEVAESPAETPV